MEKQSSSNLPHLVVFVHGLHGDVTDFEIMQNLLSTKFPDLNTHCASSNVGFLLTHEGIDVCGKRLADETEKLVQEKHPTYISFVGHSLGGLICRYCIGILYERGIFDKVKPLNFITFATPHVGSRRSVTRGYLINNIISFVTLNLFDRTGKQLMLEDTESKDGKTEEPLLLRMAQKGEKFYEGMKLFPKLVVYANLEGDLQVPFSTSAILPYNAYLSGQRKIEYFEKYPTLFEVEKLSMEQEIEKDDTTFYKNDKMADKLRKILISLNGLNWHRIGVKNNYLLAHIQIINKKPWIPNNSRDTITHFLDNFLVSSTGDTASDHIE